MLTNTNAQECYRSCDTAARGEGVFVTREVCPIRRFIEEEGVLKGCYLIYPLKSIYSTYGSGVGGFGLDISFSIGRTGLISFFGEGMLGGVGSSGGGDGGGVGVGDLKRSVSSTGSGDGLSLKASCS